jgi:GNAT superfamily N-acetyltransferase
MTNPTTAVPSTAPGDPGRHETLRDGSQVLLRPLRPDDRAAEAAFIEALSPDARHYRFLGQVHAGEALLDRLTKVDFARDFALVAAVPDDGRERIVGVARYALDPDGTGCECAVTVADAWQRRGLGAALMGRLIEVARSRGVRSMVSIDDADNAAMRDLARFLGFRSMPDPQDARQCIHRLDLQAPSA